MHVKYGLALIVVLLIFPASHAITCEEMIKEIRTITSPAFDEYATINDVKQDLLIILYTTPKDTCTSLIPFANATREFLIEFDKAYGYYLKDDEKSIEIAKELKNKLDVIKAQAPDRIESQDLISSASQALEEFLTNAGEEYLKKAENTSVTREKIRSMKLSYLSYLIAGKNLESSKIEVKLSIIEQEYKKDMKNANSFFSSGKEKYDEALKLTPLNIHYKIKAYVLTLSALRDFEKALTIYRYHHEEEKISQTEECISKAEKTREFLMKEIGIFFLGGSILLLAIALYLTNRLLGWRRDEHEHNLGNELILVED